MRPRKKIWLRVANRYLRGEWRFILEDVWLYRVVNDDPGEFHLQLTSRDLEGSRVEIRESIWHFFNKKGPKTELRRLARKKPARERIGVDAVGLLNGNSASRRTAA